MSKIDRTQVYKMYDGRCAYCGKKIHFKEMQVDHRKPKAFGGTDDILNLMPSCRRCNHYKRAHSLELFREFLKTMQNRLMDIYIFKVAVDYGIVQIKPFDGIFYFESQEGEDD